VAQAAPLPARPAGPLAIRWARLPAAAPWLLRYLAAGWTEPRVQRTAHALRALLHDAPALHAALAAEAGHPELIERHGLLTVFPDRAAFEAEALAWRVRAATGVRWLELDAGSCASACPSWTAATASACWWRMAAIAATPAPMSPGWWRWPNRAACGG
jgi:D-amino-acid dehydrogenase